MITAALIRLLTGVQARWLGCEPHPRQRIYFANHASNLDGPTIWASLPQPLRSRTRPVAAADYWEANALRRYVATRIFRCVLIARRGITRDNNPLHRMLDALDAGDSLIIFPEGGRQRDEDAGVADFRAGLWHLAEGRPEVELVPVWLENLNRIMPVGSWLPVPLIAAVSFGPPLQRVAGEEKPAFLQRARAALEALDGRDEATATGAPS